MANQTLVYAQFLIDGEISFKGEASFPVPDEFKKSLWGFELSEMRNSIVSQYGEATDVIRSQIINTINLFAHSYAQAFPSEQFKEKRKEKILELCTKFNVEVLHS